MNRSEQVDAATALRALSEGWALVDEVPDVDFLLFVNESREEASFQPKRSLVAAMERSGLIENDEGAGLPERRLGVSYESDGSVWREVTRADPIVFSYRLTAKGKKFLADAPGSTGEPVRPLTAASSPLALEIKPLKVVTYDRHAVAKLVDGFVAKAVAQIEAALSAEGNPNPRSPFAPGVVCGPKLWNALEPMATKNGLRPVAVLESSTYSMKDGKDTITERRLKDRPITPGKEERLFWESLRKGFGIDGRPRIRRAEGAEVSEYQSQLQIGNADFPPPNLAGLSLFLILEANKAKLLILVKSVPNSSFTTFGPEVSWIELLSSNPNEK